MYNFLRTAVTTILLPLSFAAVIMQPEHNKDVILVSSANPEKLTNPSSQKAFGLHLNAFEENKGQIMKVKGIEKHSIRFRYTGSGNTQIFLLNKGLAYQFKKHIYPEGYEELRSKKHLNELEQLQLNTIKKQVYEHTFQMRIMLEGASENTVIIKEQPLTAIAKYYKDNTEHQAGFFEKVTYQDVYPGIDWVIYTTENGIKYDFELAPGADPSTIRVRIMDAESIEIDSSGSLILSNRLGSVTENTPVSYQEGEAIPTAFILDSNLLQFKPGNYDISKPLTIDPTIIWSTYFGGTENDWAYSTVVDGSGNVYIAGTTESSSGMASGGFDISLGGTRDAFLAKFNSNGVQQWATYYGGTGDENGTACAVDGINNVYLAGYTNTTTGIGSGGHQTTYGGGGFTDAFLVKFDATGSRDWATYYGGNSYDYGYALATDASNNIYLAGQTQSPGNIATSGAHEETGGAYEGFLAKFNSSGVRQWGTYYGNTTGKTKINGVATDASGNVYIAGSTEAPNSMADGGHQNSLKGPQDALLVKFNSSGTRQWATYYGYDDGSTYGNALAVDGSNNVYLAGTTSATRFLATASSHQPTHAGGDDGYLVKFSSSGTRDWATFYGGVNDDEANAVAIDGSNNIYLSGCTDSKSDIADGGEQTTYGGSTDGYLVKFNSSGTRNWSSYFGGPDFDRVFGCATGSANNVYICGVTTSETAIASGGHQNTYSNKNDGFLAKFRSIAIGLPVQLSRFEGQCTGTGAELSWQTATEINNKKFVVERSENQQLWSVAGEVAGAGNSTQPRQYQFRDQKSGVANLRYYRLKQVDYDGKTTISPIIKVECNPNLNDVVSVYPNPVNQGKIFIKGWTGYGKYYLVNAMGQIVKSGTIQGTAPSIEVNGLSSGTYFISIDGNENRLREKIILR